MYIVCAIMKEHLGIHEAYEVTGWRRQHNKNTKKIRDLLDMQRKKSNTVCFDSNYHEFLSTSMTTGACTGSGVGDFPLKRFNVFKRRTKQSTCEEQTVNL